KLNPFTYLPGWCSVLLASAGCLAWLLLNPSIRTIVVLELEHSKLNFLVPSKKHCEWAQLYEFSQSSKPTQIGNSNSTRHGAGTCLSVGTRSDFSGTERNGEKR